MLLRLFESKTGLMIMPFIELYISIWSVEGVEEIMCIFRRKKLLSRETERYEDPEAKTFLLCSRNNKVFASTYPKKCTIIKHQWEVIL